ncbi:hypothetical protein ACKVV1_010383 [Pyricularia oryzae]
MSSPATKRPNFLIIVADDLGYSDTSPFGGEINTPNLARLVSDGNGRLLTNFHTASACSPTRSMLFSGTDNHIAGLGQMAENMRAHADLYRDKPGYEGYLNFRVAALSEVFQDAGYQTLMTGKWHLGLTRGTSPHARGFERSHVFLSGCHNHYNFEPQLEDPAHGLGDVISQAKFWMEDDRFLDRTKDLPKDFYSSTFYGNKMAQYLRERAGSDRPFFAYLPFTAPHWPLQAPADLVAKYKGVYDDGPSALRARRLERLVELGIVKAGTEPAPMVGRKIRVWDELSAQEKAESAKKMQVYAAMVDGMDAAIGTVLDQLEADGELDNTFVLFMSDNGAEGAMLEALPMMGGGKSFAQILDTYYDNRLENMGNKDSYVWYGPEWACASMAPSRGFKTWITEGGIRCPCIVRYPGFGRGQAQSREKSQPTPATDSFATVMDIFPTLCELAGVPLPEKTFRSREVVPIRGSSWVPHLSGATASFHDEEQHITGWELFGQRAIRQGPWKAVWMTEPRGKEKWELYNVERDPGELHDAAESEPELLEKMIEHWETYLAETGLYDPGVTSAFTKL